MTVQYRPIQFPKIPEGIPEELRKYFLNYNALVDEQLSGLYRSVSGGAGGDLTVDGNIIVNGDATLGDLLVSGDILNNINTPIITGVTYSTKVGETTKVVWTGGKLNYRGLAEITISADAAGTTNKYIYWDMASTPTTFHSTNTFTDAFGTDKFIVCINDLGTPYPCANGQPTFTNADGSINVNAIANNAMATAAIANAAIEYAQLKAASVTTDKIALLSVTEGTIAGNAITNAKIYSHTITSDSIAANTITASEIAANTITAGQIAATTITSNELASNSIIAAKIAAGAVTAGKIDALAVTTGTIDALAVTGDKIAANTITASKMNIKNFALSAGTFTDNSPGATGVAWADCKVVYNGTEYSITNGDTTSAFIYWQLASPTVFATSASTPTLGVADFLVATNTSGTHKPTWNNSTVIDGARITAASITATQIASDAITADKIKAGEITGNKLVAGTITATQLAADSVTSTQINVTDLAAVSATLGNVNISSANIGTLTVGTSNIAANAATVPVVAYTAGNVATTASNENVIQSVNLTTTGELVKFEWSYMLGAIYHRMKLKDGSTTVYDSGVMSGSLPPLFTGVFAYSPSAAAKTFNLVVSRSADGGGTLNASSRVLIATEHKR